jgi:Tyrosine-protein kinase ephrin type A/B receptor-like
LEKKNLDFSKMKSFVSLFLVCLLLQVHAIEMGVKDDNNDNDERDRRKLRWQQVVENSDANDRNRNQNAADSLSNFVDVQAASSATRNDSSCMACPAGTSSHNCSAECPNFSGHCRSPVKCKLCAPGSFNGVSGATQCQKCPPGTAAQFSGAIWCRPCPRGFETLNSIECTPCAGGYSNARIGGICTPCLAGSYSDGLGGESCSLCPAGTYSGAVAASLCSPCGAGRFNPALGSTNSSSCRQCPAGSYCPFPDTQSPERCPSGSYCLAGATRARGCESLMTSDRGAVDCHFDDSFYILIGVTVGLALLVIVSFVVFFVRRRRRHRRQQRGGGGGGHRSRRGHESKRLIPEPLPGPVYSGY